MKLSEPTEKQEQERVKLDEIVKLLFNVSKPTLINAVNGLFNTNYETDGIDIEVVKTATEYVKNDVKVIRSDLFLQITADGKTVDYHIEFQLSTDNRMVIRLFEYDIQHALDNLRLADSGEIPRLRLSQSLVIHFEKGGKIPDKYRLMVEFADGTEHEYTADVFKYWNYDDNTLIDRKLYNLIPLQLFILRAELDKLMEKQGTNSKEEIGTRVLLLTEYLLNKIMELYDESVFDINDLDKITGALNELFGHLRDRYDISEELSKGAENMIKTLYDEKVAKDAAEKAREEKTVEIAEELIKLGTPLDVIVQATKFSIEKIEEIAKNQVGLKT